MTPPWYEGNVDGHVLLFKSDAGVAYTVCQTLNSPGHLVCIVRWVTQPLTERGWRRMDSIIIDKRAVWALWQHGATSGWFEGRV